MKEIKDIISAHREATAAGKKTALATVVQVEGSSYRRPGARMLVTEDGSLTGAISGGCLEGDALKKALLAINQQKKKLVTYDTTDEDDAKFGVQLGCNGIVHILFEPIDPQDTENPIQMLTRFRSLKQDMVLCTLFVVDQQAFQPGTQLLFGGPGEVMHAGAWFQANASAELLTYIEETSLAGKSTFRTIQSEHVEYTAFIEVLKPAITLHVFGAGNDAIPLVNMASLLGWEVHVIDGRPLHLRPDRFPNADALHLQKAHSALADLAFNPRTAAVLMTHNYNYDIEVLSQLSKLECPYIGVLGPKKKMNRMFAELLDAGKPIDESALAKIYSPVGLDLGAETAEEIALSITSEIQATLSGKSARPLREKVEAIHS